MKFFWLVFLMNECNTINPCGYACRFIVKFPDDVAQVVHNAILEMKAYMLLLSWEEAGQCQGKGNEGERGDEPGEEEEQIQGMHY